MAKVIRVSRMETCEEGQLCEDAKAFFSSLWKLTINQEDLHMDEKREESLAELLKGYKEKINPLVKVTLAWDKN